MVAPMAVLALACAVLGAAPALAAPARERAAAAWAGGGPALAPLGELAPLPWISAAAAALVGATALLALAVAPACRRARRRQPDLPTWDCGYAAASPRLRYTASSFAQLVTSRFAWALRPAVHRPRIAGPFPAPSRFATHVEDAVLDRLLLPGVRRLREAAARVRAYQQGDLQRYVLYVVAALALLLLFDLVSTGW
jgi:hypothetical protein